MFTIQISGTGTNEVQRVSEELSNRVIDCVNREFINAACSNYAQLKTAELAIKEALSKCSDTLRAYLQQNHEVGKDFYISDAEDELYPHRFCIVDKPAYNYADPRNDSNGSYRATIAEIDRLATEQAVLTKERKSIEARILLEHPGMIADHHYTLVYKQPTNK